MIHVQKVQFLIWNSFGVTLKKQIYCQSLLPGEQLYWKVIYIPCFFPEIAALQAILPDIHSLLRKKHEGQQHILL